MPWFIAFASHSTQQTFHRGTFCSDQFTLSFPHPLIKAQNTIFKSFHLFSRKLAKSSPKHSDNGSLNNNYNANTTINLTPNRRNNEINQTSNYPNNNDAIDLTKTSFFARTSAQNKLIAYGNVPSNENIEYHKNPSANRLKHQNFVNAGRNANIEVKKNYINTQGEDKNNLNNKSGVAGSAEGTTPTKVLPVDLSVNKQQLAKHINAQAISPFHSLRSDHPTRDLPTSPFIPLDSKQPPSSVFKSLISLTSSHAALPEASNNQQLSPFSASSSGFTDVSNHDTIATSPNLKILHASFKDNSSDKVPHQNCCAYNYHHHDKVSAVSSVNYDNFHKITHYPVDSHNFDDIKVNIKCSFQANTSTPCNHHHGSLNHTDTRVCNNDQNCQRNSSNLFKASNSSFNDTATIVGCCSLDTHPPFNDTSAEGEHSANKSTESSTADDNDNSIKNNRKSDNNIKTTNGDNDHDKNNNNNNNAKKENAYRNTNKTNKVDKASSPIQELLHLSHLPLSSSSSSSSSSSCVKTSEMSTQTDPLHTRVPSDVHHSQLLSQPSNQLYATNRTSKADGNEGNLFLLSLIAAQTNHISSSSPSFSLSPTSTPPSSSSPLTTATSSPTSTKMSLLDIPVSLFLDSLNKGPDTPESNDQANLRAKLPVQTHRPPLHSLQSSEDSTLSPHYGHNTDYSLANFFLEKKTSTTSITTSPRHKADNILFNKNSDNKRNFSCLAKAPSFDSDVLSMQGSEREFLAVFFPRKISIAVSKQKNVF